MSESSDPILEEKPPLFKSWSTWYWLVLANLAISILLLLLITLKFS